MSPVMAGYISGVCLENKYKKRIKIKLSLDCDYFECRELYWFVLEMWIGRWYYIVTWGLMDLPISIDRLFLLFLQKNLKICIAHQSSLCPTILLNCPRAVSCCYVVHQTAHRFPTRER
ncbi:unnamed protein product [Choristocarpus tenellus]